MQATKSVILADGTADLCSIKARPGGTHEAKGSGVDCIQLFPRTPLLRVLDTWDRCLIGIDS
ncbi:hypothetical protein HZF05_09520 [Sphingomonas sp. CGMCC 1.13654]|uniref:Uncharacterized protein n=1 Tax=Sphingomonas chungangi TaxID=2683589 RepID=A0A838L873_9SPHN|nr:hypothetical protein [Sphingomonas chungangi]MBA2934336.1 hypothetical protein [Sphingomonas chungangi]MVW57376.1 hypothetical protein [Sphingomonas chungangi]